MLTLKTRIIITCICLSIVFALVLIAREINGKVDFKKYIPFSSNQNSENSASTLKISSSIPKIETSEAFYPLGSKIVEGIIDKDNYHNELSHVSTPQACQDIIDNKTDISIVSEMTPSHKEILINNDKITMVPIAKEALIFYVQKDNSIASLSTEEIQKIYNEEITNWNELGGNYLSIIPYQLEKNSGGSEACFSTIVKENSSSNTPSNIAYDMKNIIDLPSWNSGGIGYAFNMFYSKLYLKSNLKKLSINNIEPSIENITQGKYPLLFNLYFIYRTDNPNPNIQKILEWILSPEGQDIIKNCELKAINTNN